MHDNFNYGNIMGNKQCAILVNQKAKQRITFPQKRFTIWRWHKSQHVPPSTIVPADVKRFESFHSILDSSRKPSQAV